MEGTIVRSSATEASASETLEFHQVTEAVYSQWFFKEIMVNKHGGKASYVNASPSMRKSPTWQMPRCGVPFGCNYSKAPSEGPSADDDSAAASASSSSEPAIMAGKKMTCDLDVSGNERVRTWAREIDQHILNVGAANSKKWFSKAYDASKLAMVYREIAPDPKEESYKTLFRTKVVWYPRDTTTIIRYAGVLNEDGSIEETNAYISTGAMLTPDPVSDRESHFYYLVKNSRGTEYCDKVPMIKANGEPIKCARSGRPLYRYLSPFDVKPNYEVEPIVELNSLWFTNKQFGCTITIQHAIVYPTTTSKKPAFKIGGTVIREASRMDDDSDGRKFAISGGAGASGSASTSSASGGAAGGGGRGGGPEPSDADDDF
jgi:hypothetical protein